MYICFFSYKKTPRRDTCKSSIIALMYVSSTLETKSSINRVIYFDIVIVFVFITWRVICGGSRLAKYV